MWCHRKRMTQRYRTHADSGWRQRGIFPLPMALCALVWLTTATAQAAKFTASLDRDTVTLGERATLSLTFEGGSPNDVPSLPSIANLQVSYVGPSSHFSFVNGQVSSTVTHVFHVTPRQPGDFTIPALTAVVGSERLQTQPLRLKVLQPGAPPPEAVQSGSQIAFMRFVLPKQEIFVGETVIGELQIYFRDVVQNFGNFHLTALPADGFTVGKSVQGQQRNVQVGNAVYRVIPLYYALTPIKTGPLNVGPVTASVVVELASNNRRRDPFFEQFGIRSLFDRAEQRQLTLATEAEAVRALPLPAENVPPGFNGAVGSYSLTVTAGPTNVATGDPITVRVQISGRGALDAVTLPEQTAWRGFKTYPPTANLETADALGLQGTKTFEQIVSPESTDIKEIPPFTFTFFDPEAKEYRTLTQPAVPLIVRPGGVAVMPTVARAGASAADAPPAQDIVHIRQRLGKVAAAGPPLVLQPWFLTVQSVPVLAFLAAFIWRQRADSLAQNPRLRRQRQVAKIVSDGLIELRRLAAENESDKFFATLFRLLQEQLGERLDCPASAITEAVIDEKLRPRGLPEAALAELHELFQACNLARYAPAQSSQELAAMVPRLEQALADIRQIRV